MLQLMEEVLIVKEKAMEEDIFLKSAVIVKRQGIPLIHVIENMALHLIQNLKIRTMIRVI